MATCSQCGRPVSVMERDVFTGACPACRGVGARPASLGCGTLLLIGLVVLFFTKPGLRDVESHISALQKSVEALKKASDAQTNEIRDLRKVIEDLRPGAAGKEK